MKTIAAWKKMNSLEYQDKNSAAIAVLSIYFLYDAGIIKILQKL